MQVCRDLPIHPRAQIKPRVHRYHIHEYMGNVRIMKLILAMLVFYQKNNYLYDYSEIYTLTQYENPSFPSLYGAYSKTGVY